ncbi:MAG TPA: hypothetical protein VGM44_20975 [Polyangiaceae bacterium]|jgi:hypothetical protein
MTRKQDTTTKVKSKAPRGTGGVPQAQKTSRNQRIPVYGLTPEDIRRTQAEFDRWAKVRSKRIIDASIDELRYALELNIELERPWTPPDTLEKRQGQLVRICAWVLDRVQRPRRKNETKDAYQERLQQKILYQAEGLIEAVKKLEPTAAAFTAQSVCRLLGAARKNESAAKLAFELAKLANIWDRATVASLRKAEYKTR